ncbi:piggyBac transposable element-derived protein 4 [Nephila pilipes]|uniref:PiggyBac transposable element-derived protein 4 n=1 Tax=Nephila pilipes TaxID=299642 RepID=A0A8X6IAH2_NEPPI|nr:piggyBac transposable element-derived protein 4 [Nephila pilipes]
MDRRPVTILCNLVHPTETHHVQRKEKDGSNKMVPCLRAISDYNKNMGYADHFNHLKSVYKVDQKSKKWWHRIFFHLTYVAIAISFILYKMCHGDLKKISPKVFRKDIVTELVNLGQSLELPKLLTKSPVSIKRRKLFVPNQRG